MLRSTDPTVGASRIREAGIGTVLVLASVGLCLLIGEVLARTVSEDPKRWEFTNFVTYPPVAEGRWTIMQPDPELGYAPRAGYSGTNHGGKALLTFDEQGLRVHRRGSTLPSTLTQSVLVVGDSYAMGEEVADEETFPAHLQDLLDRRVLNGGVAGYGIDQIVMRAARLVPEHRPELLIVSFIGDDVRRAQERIVWGIEKPYFNVVGDTLHLRNVPVPPHVVRPLDAFRRVAGYSFLADIAMDRLGMTEYWLAGQPRQRTEAHDQGAKVSCLLMDRLRQLGRAFDMNVLVVAQYTPLAWMSSSTRHFETAVTGALLECAQRAGHQTLDTADAIEAAVKADGLNAYYADGHMNNAGNRLTAELMADRLVR